MFLRNRHAKAELAEPDQDQERIVRREKLKELVTTRIASHTLKMRGRHSSRFRAGNHLLFHPFEAMRSFSITSIEDDSKSIIALP
jgi:hypothetical protein